MVGQRLDAGKGKGHPDLDILRTWRGAVTTMAAVLRLGSGDAVLAVQGPGASSRYLVEQ